MHHARSAIQTTTHPPSRMIADMEGQKLSVPTVVNVRSLNSARRTSASSSVTPNLLNEL